jgi:hypothetical protein
MKRPSGSLEAQPHGRSVPARSRQSGRGAAPGLFFNSAQEDHIADEVIE